MDQNLQSVPGSELATETGTALNKTSLDAHVSTRSVCLHASGLNYTVLRCPFPFLLRRLVCAGAIGLVLVVAAVYFYARHKVRICAQGGPRENWH